MVYLGDYVQCPQCNRMGRVVWVSKNGSVMGVQCAASHCMENVSDPFGYIHRRSKPQKNSVFLVKITETNASMTKISE